MRLRVKISGVLAVVGLVALLVWFATGPRPELARLPDGSTLKVLGATAGLAPFTTEKPWQRLAKKVLPLRLQRWLPATVTASCSGSSNSITVFLEHAGPAITPVTPYPWRAIAVVDDAGFRFPIDYGVCTLGATGKLVRGIILRAYPRRQHDFDLRFLGPGNQSLARLQIPNPNRGPFPEWTPERL